MRKIAVINFKGGTGKTTTVVNVGAGLAMRGKRVLLVDVDAQGSLALSLGASYQKSIADVLTTKTTIQEAITRARPNLDLLPADNSLLQAQRAVSRYVKWQGVLAAALAPIEAAYDFVLLDCAASLTLLNVNALTYAEEIFVPTQVEYLSLVGINQVLENLARVRFPNQPRQAVSDLGISLVIPTMYDVRKSQSRRLLGELRQTYGMRVAPPIRVNVRLSEAPAYQKTIFEYAPSSPGAFDYNRLVDTILQETLLAGEEPIGLQRPFQPTRGERPVVPKEPPTEADEEPLGLQPLSQPARSEGPVVPEETPPEAGLPPDSQPPPEPSTLSGQCPYCGIPLSTLQVAGYRVFHCERCGYQKQVLIRDLRIR